MITRKDNIEHLEIYNLAYKLAIEIHNLSLKLPEYELYEQGSQIRRSSKSIKDNIVEGYGRKRYKADFIKFLVYAHASCNERISQLKMLNDIHFKDSKQVDLLESYDKLGRMINSFIQYLDKNWKTKINK